MHRSLKQVGTRKGTLAGTGGQKGGMFGESIGPVDKIPSDAPLGGNRQGTQQGVPAQRAGCSSAVRKKLSLYIAAQVKEPQRATSLRMVVAFLMSRRKALKVDQNRLLWRVAIVR
jgi:hypothetical protein